MERCTQAKFAVRLHANASDVIPRKSCGTTYFLCQWWVDAGGASLVVELTSLSKENEPWQEDTHGHHLHADFEGGYLISDLYVSIPKLSFCFPPRGGNQHNRDIHPAVSKMPSYFMELGVLRWLEAKLTEKRAVRSETRPREIGQVCTKKYDFL